MNYGTLTGPKSVKGSIRSWVNYDPIDVEGILLDAQQYIYQRVRVREMKWSAPVTITQGSETAPLPVRFLDPITLLHSNGLPIEPKDERELEQLRPRQDDGTIEEGTPMAYSIYEELIQFDVAAEASSTARMLFYRLPDMLGQSNQTNFLTTRYANILRSACLMGAADQMHDTAEYSRWKDRTDEQIGVLSIENDLAMRGRDYTASVR